MFSPRSSAGTAGPAKDTYITVQDYNDSDAPRPASYTAYTTTELYTNVRKAGMIMTVARLRIPTAGIPIDPYGIPFESWAVGIGKNGGVPQLAYVRQPNELATGNDLTVLDATDRLTIFDEEGTAIGFAPTDQQNVTMVSSQIPGIGYLFQRSIVGATVNQMKISDVTYLPQPETTLFTLPSTQTLFDLAVCFEEKDSVNYGAIWLLLLYPGETNYRVEKWLYENQAWTAAITNVDTSMAPPTLDDPTKPPRLAVGTNSTLFFAFGGLLYSAAAPTQSSTTLTLSPIHLGLSSFAVKELAILPQPSGASTSALLALRADVEDNPITESKEASFVTSSFVNGEVKEEIFDTFDPTFPETSATVTRSTDPTIAAYGGCTVYPDYSQGGVPSSQVGAGVPQNILLATGGPLVFSAYYLNGNGFSTSTRLGELPTAETRQTHQFLSLGAAHGTIFRVTSTGALEGQPWQPRVENIHFLANATSVPGSSYTPHTLQNFSASIAATTTVFTNEGNQPAIVFIKLNPQDLISIQSVYVLKPAAEDSFELYHFSSIPVEAFLATSALVGRPSPITTVSSWAFYGLQSSPVSSHLYLEPMPTSSTEIFGGFDPIDIPSSFTEQNTFSQFFHASAITVQQFGEFVNPFRNAAAPGNIFWEYACNQAPMPRYPIEKVGPYVMWSILNAGSWTGLNNICNFGLAAMIVQSVSEPFVPTVTNITVADTDVLNACDCIVAIDYYPPNSAMTQYVCVSLAVDPAETSNSESVWYGREYAHALFNLQTQSNVLSNNTIMGYSSTEWTEGSGETPGRTFIVEERNNCIVMLVVQRMGLPSHTTYDPGSAGFPRSFASMWVYNQTTSEYSQYMNDNAGTASTQALPVMWGENPNGDAGSQAMGYTYRIVDIIPIQDKEGRNSCFLTVFNNGLHSMLSTPAGGVNAFNAFTVEYNEAGATTSYLVKTSNGGPMTLNQPNCTELMSEYAAISMSWENHGFTNTDSGNILAVLAGRPTPGSETSSDLIILLFQVMCQYDVNGYITTITLEYVGASTPQTIAGETQGGAIGMRGFSFNNTNLLHNVLFQTANAPSPQTVTGIDGTALRSSIYNQNSDTLSIVSADGKWYNSPTPVTTGTAIALTETPLSLIPWPASTPAPEFSAFFEVQRFVQLWNDPTVNGQQVVQIRDWQDSASVLVTQAYNPDTSGYTLQGNIGFATTGQPILMTHTTYGVYTMGVTTGSNTISLLQEFNSDDVQLPLRAILFNKPSPQEGPPEPIYTFQSYVNAINLALTKACDGLLPSPPEMMFNAAERRFLLNMPAAFASADQSGNTWQLYLNQNMQNIFKFPQASAVTTTIDSMPLVTIQTLQRFPSFYGVSPYQFYVITQEGVSFDSLWNIVRFVVRCPGMPIIGNFEGTDGTSNSLTDIYPDLTTLNVGAAEIFTPLQDRWYAMTSLQAVQSYRFEIWYDTRDGVSRPVMINPGSNWGILVCFRRQIDSLPM